MTISFGEVEFYNQIKKHVKVLFDVGCREDSPYIALSEKKEIHLFEPNPEMFAQMAKKYYGFKTSNEVTMNNFGLGNKTEEKDYYADVQSFIKRTTHVISKSKPVKLKIVKFMDYVNQNVVEDIDFLKIDTEGYEPEILYDGKEYIKEKVGVVQFEYASTWLDKELKCNLETVMFDFGSVFNFFFLFDENHPFAKYYDKIITPITDSIMVSNIDECMVNAYGCNIVMIRKK